MKKLTSLALALLLIFALAACGGGTTTSQPPEEPSDSAAPSEEPSQTPSEEPSEEPSEAPAPGEGVDLAAFYETMFADAKADGLSLVPTEGEMLEMTYPGLSDVECRQLVAYAPMMTATAYEVVLVEVADAADVETVKDILQARIDAQVDGGAWYPETIEQWENNSRLVDNGNYVMMVVGDSADAEVDAFNALFA